MKRCPTCNLTFEEEWLSFCTQDGTSLIEDSARFGEPPPTMMGPPMPPSVSPSEQPTLNIGGHTPQPPPVQYGAPAPMQAGWQPPPPPPYVMPPNKSLATASMVVGIIGTVAWLCIGPIPAIVAVVLGIVALSQIRKNPDRVGGTTQAWVGILTGGLTTLIYAVILIFYIIVLVIAGQHP
jgi:hypothetical protein